MQASQDKENTMKIMAMLSNVDESEGNNRVGIENVAFLAGGLLAKRGFV